MGLDSSYPMGKTMVELKPCRRHLEDGQEREV